MPTERWVQLGIFTRTHVAGVTHDNSDGSSREQIIQRLEDSHSDSDFQTELVRDLRKPEYPEAIAVMTGLGQIGYIPKDLAEFMSPTIDDGTRRYTATIYEISCFETDDGFTIPTVRLDLLEWEYREARGSGSWQPAPHRVLRKPEKKISPKPIVPLPLPLTESERKAKQQELKERLLEVRQNRESNRPLANFQNSPPESLPVTLQREKSDRSLPNSQDSVSNSLEDSSAVSVSNEYVEVEICFDALPETQLLERTHPVSTESHISNNFEEKTEESPAIISETRNLVWSHCLQRFTTQSARFLEEVLRAGWIAAKAIDSVFKAASGGENHLTWILRVAVFLFLIIVLAVSFS